MDSFCSVDLYLYDLTNGMAKQLSPMFLGKQIDGIWHTGIVVYGKEFYFGGGICVGSPADTPYGIPVQIIEMGTTEIPEEIFNDYLKEIAPKFIMNTYDLIKNNCNNFTDDCSQFLLGKGIPEFITGLPNEILATPIGATFRPLIESMQAQMNSASSQFRLPELYEGTNNAQALNFGAPLPAPGGFGFPAAATQPDYTLDSLTQVKNLTEFNKEVEAAEATVAFFYSDNCGPCNIVKPLFKAIADEYKVTLPDIKFVVANVDVAVDVASKFNITSIPSFITFSKQERLGHIVGASEAPIRDLIRNLEIRVKTKAVRVNA